MVIQIPNLSRRKVLKIATVTIGGSGVAASSIPFVRSMSPSEGARATGAPVEVDLQKLEPGQLSTVEWRGRPVWVLHRTPHMLASLSKHDDQLVDPHSDEPQQPAYAKNETRSIEPRYFVAVGICTHLGCVPIYRPDPTFADLDPHWHGGFYCPCHGSQFDLAGRVYKNMPAPRNLEVPPHTYLTEKLLLIGEDKTSL
jgi:ubiquinol-cytochrome c reductase iron-sulfur subunit